MIIVLEKGRLVEQGSFAELLKRKGIFTRLAAHQGIYAA
jgi:ABC-type multidrug transport system fused ATPase/permease subunit